MLSVCQASHLVRHSARIKIPHLVFLHLFPHAFIWFCIRYFLMDHLFIPSSDSKHQLPLGLHEVHVRFWLMSIEGHCNRSVNTQLELSRSSRHGTSMKWWCLITSDTTGCKLGCSRLTKKRCQTRVIIPWMRTIWPRLEFFKLNIWHSSSSIFGEYTSLERRNCRSPPLSSKTLDRHPCTQKISYDGMA